MVATIEVEKETVEGTRRDRARRDRSIATWGIRMEQAGIVPAQVFEAAVERSDEEAITGWFIEWGRIVSICSEA